MTDRELLTEAGTQARPEAADRRAFFARALGAAAIGGAALAAGRPAAAQTAPTPTPTPSPSPSASPTSSLFDSDYMNFALNIEYLQANFLSFATTGAALAAADIDGSTGTGTTAATPGAATGGRLATLTDPVVAQYVREMAADDLAHVRYLRTSLSSLRVAQPAIDLSPAGAFTTAMRTAGVVTAGETFDPYASDQNILLALFLIKDAAVAAYKAMAPLIGSGVVLEALGGLIATESYHAATVRASLYRLGSAAGSTLIQATEQISDLRDAFDGAPAENLAIGVGPNADQGITPTADGSGQPISNIVPANANGLVFSRSPAATINILYLSSAAAAASGGFFPAGLNGNIKTARPA